MTEQIGRLHYGTIVVLESNLSTFCGDTLVLLLSYFFVIFSRRLIVSEITRSDLLES